MILHWVACPGWALLHQLCRVVCLLLPAAYCKQKAEVDAQRAADKAAKEAAKEAHRKVKWHLMQDRTAGHKAGASQQGRGLSSVRACTARLLPRSAAMGYTAKPCCTCGVRQL